MLFETVAKIEKEHEGIYLTIIKNVQESYVFEKEEEVVWECKNCGHIHKGKKALELCPVCDHPKSYFMIHPQNY